MKRAAIWAYHLLTPIFDPFYAIRGLFGYFRYVSD